MTRNHETRALVIGLDAAEPSLVRQLMEQGEMPALKSLLARGAWRRVHSPADIGSGAVWPTFITGEDPKVHGIYGEWAWQPHLMNINRYTGRHLTPFWQSLAQRGATIGVLDVPFAPIVGLPAGFEVSEWGAHDALEGRMQLHPASLSDLVSQTRPHPFQRENIDASGPDDYQRLTRVASESLDGVKLRGEVARRLILETEPNLALVTFTEIHHAAHYFWHALAPSHPFYADDSFRNSRAVAAASSALLDIYREVDKQIAGLIEVAGREAFVMIFSLHGMQPTHGIPSFLAPLLLETKWSRITGLSSQSWRERALSAFAALKRHTPLPLKKLYYKTVPRTATYQLAQTTMLPSYDWSRTRAFSLPTDQHGWIRLNLMNREARGIVPLEQYEATCCELRQMLLELVTEEGEPLVRDCFITSNSREEALAQPLPDLIVHYTDAAFRSPLRIKGLSLEAKPTGKKFTGQHAPEGFLLATDEQGVIPDAATISAQDLHRLIVASLAPDAVTR
jgi:predicted AlkP superfamily phosphohydrolase/phosphomutase